MHQFMKDVERFRKEFINNENWSDFRDEWLKERGAGKVVSVEPLRFTSKPFPFEVNMEKCKWRKKMEG